MRSVRRVGLLILISHPVALFSIATGQDFHEDTWAQLPAQADASLGFAFDGVEDEWIHPASFYQPPPILRPQPSIVPETPLPPSAASIFNRDQEDPLQGRLRSRLKPLRGIVESLPPTGTTRPATDAGGLLRQPAAYGGVATQRRTPIVHDPRIRGSRVGQLASAGSYWVPARIDLNTPLSNFDSQIVENLQVTKGPYDVRQGPGLNFLAVDLVDSPRFEDMELHGSSRVAYHTNGEQWHGRQTIQGGHDNWGFQLGYTHRTGTDYRTAAGADIPSSFNSRAWDLALGRDLDEDRRVEVHALRLDQTDMEFAGQAFDISALGTNGYEIEYTQLNADFADRIEAEAWYNDTRFVGDTGGAAKRRVLPAYQQLNLSGVTDVFSASTGARVASAWETDNDGVLTAGLDVKYMRQRLDEFVTYTRLGLGFSARSPIPETETVDPGVFLDYATSPSDHWRIMTGVRLDSVSTGVIDDSSRVTDVGTDRLITPANERGTLQDFFRTDDLTRSFTPWAAFVASEYEVNDAVSLTAAAGHSERPPSPTELYAAQPFMFLLQNGLNTVRGDPFLDPERQTQIDAGINVNAGRLRASAHGFYAWMNDYITFENIGTVNLPGNPVAQINLQYVNTELATISGFETRAEYDILPSLMGLATLSYTEGRDLTRNGGFATDSDGIKTPGLPRGTFGGAPLTDHEALPGIVPLDSRLGLRLHDPSVAQAWWLELSTRLVAPQHKIATSLFEASTPGFVVCDVRGAYRFSDQISVIAGVENFTNERFQEHLDFHTVNGLRVLQPGVNFYLGSEVRY